MRLLLATNNQGKVAEIRAIFRQSGTELVTPRELGCDFSVREDGVTFEDNARVKAIAAYQQFGLPALADDSGLEIDALGGRPGVASARFMGEKTSFADKCAEILRRMREVPAERRTARFHCVAVIAGIRNPSETRSFHGVCEGRIALEAFGAGGFGYDPIFVPAGWDKTFAELPAEVKNRISHRGMAFGKVMAYLDSLAQ